MHRTSCVRHAMASTRGGMRRILKQKLPVTEYIRKAVETGVYRSSDELEKVRKERRESADDLRTIMRRFRQDVVRGSHIHDYPVEYRILKQHPPLPDPPRIPARIAKKMREAEHPAARLVQRILDRQEKRHSFGGSGSGSGSGTATTAEEHYRRLLGGMSSSSSSNRVAPPPPSRATALGQKPAYVQKAYAAAIKCFELQRTTPGGMTDDEALAQVDALLAEHDAQEREASAVRARWAQEHVKQQQQKQLNEPSPQGLGDAKKESSEPVSGEARADGAAPPPTTTTHSESATSPPRPGNTTATTASPPLRSIFADNPRGVEGMMRWSERLRAVPYRQWTIGASTALDHWIARQVLRWSEESWQLLLEGGDPRDPTHLLTRGRDLIKAREALFPETVLWGSPGAADRLTAEVDEEEDEEDEDEDSDALEAEAAPSSSPRSDDEKTIDELLASLGGLSMPDGSSSTAAANNKDPAGRIDVDDDDDDDGGDAADLDRKVTQLVNELQDWRRRNADRPFKDWSKEEKEEFNRWMRTYVAAVSSDAAKSSVDYRATREALLSQPPVSEEDSTAFWGSLEDEGRAAALLETMRRTGPPPGATVLHSAFWDLPYATQLERLLNLGALRPLLDEYAKESDRVRFLQRYGDTLLTGVELEHLVPDPDGPVRARDLGPSATALNVSGDDRFRVALLPYRASTDTSAEERTRALYAAWNEHKAGRARYEEKLFRTGRLGLRYDDEDPDAE